MRINLELDDLIAMLAGIASEAKDEARIKFGASADAAIAGIALLRQFQVEALSVHEYDLTPEPEAALLMAAVKRYCRVWCKWSAEMAPGAHERCDHCPLAPFTVNVVEELVDKVMGPG